MDDISRAIGSLEASVKAVAASQDTLQKHVKTMEDDISTVKVDTAFIKLSLSELGPAARKINNWEQRMIGVGLVVASGGGVATLLLTKLKDWIIG